MQYRIFQATTNPADNSLVPQDGVAINGAATVYSLPLSGSHTITAGSAQIITTGTLTGTFTFWWSNKEQPNLATDADWVTQATTIPAPAGAATNAGETLPRNNTKWFRYKLVNASGVGSVFGYVELPKTNAS